MLGILDLSLDPNLLNTHFSAITTTTTTASSTRSVSDATVTVDPPDSPDSVPVFSFRCVDAAELIAAVGAIRSGASGPDGIPPKFIKILLPWIVQPVLHIFNTCLTTSQFPSPWKIATVLPVAKSSKAKIPSDFRPISLLCFFAKVLEKLISWQLVAYLENFNLLGPCQSGFRKSHSCETALLSVTSDIRRALDDNQLCVLALLDFSKAFDTLSHSNLLTKLYTAFRFHSTAVSLVQSFLSGRSQRVKVRNCFSESLTLTCGVPQGSILGPLLFVMYVNDLPDVIENSRIHLYADDVQLYLSRPSGLVEDCIDRLNSDLRSVAMWAARNNLLLNPEKSQCIAFYRRPFDTSDLPPVLLNNSVLPFADRVRNLGVFLDSKMRCCDHINYIVGKIYGGLRRLWLSSAILPMDTRKLLVKSLLLPYFTNSCLIFPHLDSFCATKLRVAFNDCTRFVFGLRRYTHISPYSRSLLGCSLKEFLMRRLLASLHSIIYTKTPGYLYDRLEFLRSNRRFDLLTPRFRYSVMEDSYFVRAIRAWNTLPSEIQRVGSAGRFRGLLAQSDNSLV